MGVYFGGMPRTRVSERTRWEQLANAVIELGRNVKLLEDRVEQLERPKSTMEMVDESGKLVTVNVLQS